MVLDKKGKLFGKVSIVDVAVILVAVLAVIAMASKIGQPIKSGSGQGTATAQYTVEVQKIRDASFNAVNKGDYVYDQQTGTCLGTVTEKTKQPAKDEVKKTDGTYVEAEVPGRYDMTLTIGAKGRKTDTGFYLEGKKELLKNADIDFTNENIAFSGTVLSIND